MFLCPRQTTNKRHRRSESRTRNNARTRTWTPQEDEGHRHILQRMDFSLSYDTIFVFLSLQHIFQGHQPFTTLNVEWFSVICSGRISFSCSDLRCTGICQVFGPWQPNYHHIHIYFVLHPIRQYLAFMISLGIDIYHQCASRGRHCSTQAVLQFLYLINFITLCHSVAVIMWPHAASVLQFLLVRHSVAVIMWHCAVLQPWLVRRSTAVIMWLHAVLQPLFIFIFILLRYSVAAIINKAALRQLLPYHSVVVDIRPRAALRPHHVMYIIPAFLGESLPSFAALAWPVFGWAEGASPPACDQGLSSLVTMRGPSPKQRLLVLF